VHDGITFENQGKPAAVICTAPFIPTGKMMAHIQGNPDYPFAVIPHPIGALTEEQLAERARLALAQVLQLLVGKG
jgi:hypothetical protein